MAKHEPITPSRTERVRKHRAVMRRRTYEDGSTG